MREIKLTFEWDGETVNKEVNGFTGQGCLGATDFIDSAIGKVANTEFKQEFYAPEPVQTDQQNYLSI